PAAGSGREIPGRAARGARPFLRREPQPGAHVVLARRPSSCNRWGFRRARVDRLVAEDPVVARRERIARLAALGIRIGYIALGVAIVAFFIGAATAFPTWTVGVAIGGLAVSGAALPIP